MAEAWNPRFVAYATAHGLGPGEMYVRGGWTADFIAWISARWSEWESLRGRKPGSAKSLADHAAFNAWLARQVAA